VCVFVCVVVLGCGILKIEVERIVTKEVLVEVCVCVCLCVRGCV